MKKCVICGSKPEIIFNYKNFEYYRCPNCTIVSTFPLPSKETIEKHYIEGFKKGNYKFLHLFAPQYKKVYAQFVDILETKMKDRKDTLKGKKILDIGCFTGEFLELMQKKGADVYGLELQEAAVKIANKKLGNRVYQADISTYDFPQTKYDIITLLGLVEHVPDPMTLLKRCSTLLKKDGILMIQTPNSGSFFAKTMGKYWPPYSPVEHIHLSSKKSLDFALHKAGFKDVTFKAHWKKLPLGYVYNMFNTFGSEFHSLLKPLDKVLRSAQTRAPFYVGEMIVIASKK